MYMEPHGAWPQQSRQELHYDFMASDEELAAAEHETDRHTAHIRRIRLHLLMLLGCCVFAAAVGVSVNVYTVANHAAWQDDVRREGAVVFALPCVLDVLTPQAHSGLWVMNGTLFTIIAAQILDDYQVYAPGALVPYAACELPINAANFTVFRNTASVFVSRIVAHFGVSPGLAWLCAAMAFVVTSAAVACGLFRTHSLVLL